MIAIVLPNLCPEIVPNLVVKLEKQIYIIFMQHSSEIAARRIWSRVGLPKTTKAARIEKVDKVKC